MTLSQARTRLARCLSPFFNRQLSSKSFVRRRAGRRTAITPPAYFRGTIVPFSITDSARCRADCSLRSRAVLALCSTDTSRLRSEVRRRPSRRPSVLAPVAHSRRVRNRPVRSRRHLRRSRQARIRPRRSRSVRSHRSSRPRVRTVNRSRGKVRTCHSSRHSRRDQTSNPGHSSPCSS